MKDKDRIGYDWQKVGTSLRQAVIETSNKVGGQSLTDEVLQRYGDDKGVLPNPEILKLLEAREPGSAEAILSRAEQLQIAKNRGFLARIKDKFL